MSSHAVTKRAKRKLRSNRGDSLAEVLIALLIAAVALVMLASMINASANMIGRSKVFMSDYYTAGNDLNTKPGGTDNTQDITVSVSFLNEENSVDKTVSKTYSAVYRKNEDFQQKTLVSFWKA